MIYAMADLGRLWFVLAEGDYVTAVYVGDAKKTWSSTADQKLLFVLNPRCLAEVNKRVMLQPVRGAIFGQGVFFTHQFTEQKETWKDWRNYNYV